MSNLLYPFMAYNIYLPNTKLKFCKYIVSINYAKNIPTSFGLWGNSRVADCDSWLRIKEYFCPIMNGAEQTDKNMFYNEFIKLINDRNNIDVLISPIDDLSLDFAELLQSNDKVCKIIFYSGNQNDYYEKITKSLQSGKIKISEFCYDTKREHLKCTLDNPFGDNGLMSEIGLFVDYIYNTKNNNTISQFDKYNKLLSFITDYYDKIKKEKTELYSDGQWHTVSLLDGEYFALNRIMDKVNEIQNINDTR